ncbi:MAG: epoxide hydrolase N-terminal domain-containing protein, partial [Propionibacteriaceae bacterium]
MTATAAGQTGTIRPYTIAIPQEALDDLQRRLANTRYPVAAPGDNWEYGTPVSYLQKMITAWQQFDWRQQEARMNAVPNFVTEIEDQTVHFVHV